jgi:hypothetical protein
LNLSFNESAVVLVGGQWHEPAGKYTTFCGKGNENHELGHGSFVHEEVISAVKRV